MNEHDAFLRSIRDCPDDDTPRLVYSDYLEEQGDDLSITHAQLIRLQIQRSSLPLSDPSYMEIKKQEDRLIRRYERRWLGMIPEGLVRWEFRRGFVENAVIEGGRFPEVIKELSCRHPVRDLTLARLGGDSSEVARIAENPVLEQCTHLRFRPPSFQEPGLGDEGLAIVLASPHLTHLEHLELDRQRLTNNGLIRLSQARLPALRSLRLSQNRPNPVWRQTMQCDGIEVFIKSSLFQQLEAIELENIPLGVKGSALLAQENMSKLRLLGLSRCELGSGGIDQLCAAESLVNLEVLDLKNNQLGSIGAELLAQSHSFPRLRVLSLSSNYLTDEGGVRLARSAVVHQLAQLTLRRNHLANVTARAFAHGGKYQRLEVLDISYNELTLGGAKALLNSANFPALKTLDLRKNRLFGKSKQLMNQGSQPGRRCRV